MVYRTRIKYTDAQKAEMWDRWQKDESLNSIARLFNRGHSSTVTTTINVGGGQVDFGQFTDRTSCKNEPGGQHRMSWH